MSDKLKAENTNWLQFWQMLRSESPEQWKIIRRRRRRSQKRFAIEARQVTRAHVIVNRAPTLIHRGKAAR